MHKLDSPEWIAQQTAYQIALQRESTAYREHGEDSPEYTLAQLRRMDAAYKLYAIEAAL